MTSSSALSPVPRPAPRVTSARLSGVSARLDQRINAYRPEIADIALADRVFAPRYAAGVEMPCMATSAVRAAPGTNSVAVSELLPGESFTVFDRVAGWAWGQCGVDAYVGWVEGAALAAPSTDLDHVVTAPQALVFAEPSIKAAVIASLPMGARIATAPHDASFVALATGGYVHRRHLAPPSGDAVDLAGGFIGSPYKWGGRTRDGLDCSGLVQIVLAAFGIACPRDSDQQLAFFPAVAAADRRRGDLAFFPGHVGILVDADRLLHANAFHMTTLIEPLAAVVARLEPVHDAPLTGIARPPCRPPGPSL